MVTKSGRVKIVDFGLAQPVGFEVPREVPDIPDTQTQTHAGLNGRDASAFGGRRRHSSNIVPGSALVVNRPPRGDEEEDVRRRIGADETLTVHADDRVGLKLAHLVEALGRRDLIPQVDIANSNVHGVEPAAAAFAQNVAVRYCRPVGQAADA